MGYKVSFLNEANDGVSSDEKFVRQTLLEFLKGHSSFTAMTDLNHNVKNFRYQEIISGNKMKTIGNTFVDTELLNLANIAKELVYIKDFASDLLVLRLASSETVQEIMELLVSDTKSVCATCVTLLFMRAHLYGVNCEANLSPKTRVYLTWSSLIFMLHIDGVHVTTKRNWIVASISLCFLYMRSDVRLPHRLTSETSEHSIAHMQAVTHEFTMLDLISIINKKNRTWFAMTQDNLRTIRAIYEATEYAATASIGQESATVPTGTMQIETDPNVIDMLKENNWSVSRCIWSEVRTTINTVNERMRTFLTNNFGVREFQPFIEEFPESRSPDELVRHLEVVMKKSDDQLFKK